MKQLERKEFLKHKMLQGQCSPEELAELYTLIQADSPQEWDAVLQKQWNQSLQVSEKSHVPNALLPEIIKQANWRRRMKGFQRFSLKAAAALVLLISATALIMKFGTGLAKFAETSMMIEHTVPYGKLSKYTLPDGSVVWLNAGSTLTYPRFFLRNERHVSLSGEAFFKVARDESKPFFIDAAALQVKVLGTSFSVKAYPGEDHNKVTVASGLVQVNHEADSLTVLTKGLQLSYHASQNSYAVDQHDPSLAAHWTTGGLLFDDASFEEVARTLEKHFNVSVKLESKKPSCRFTIVMPPRLNVTEVLDKLKLINDFSYTQQNNKITITNIDC